jgi:pimeloyl-ACP methyl ester carboxylesterase
MLSDFPYPIQHTTGRDASHLAYVTSGKGAPVVLVHGSLCDMRYWKAQIPALTRDFRVFSISLRGYWPDGPQTDLSGFSGEQHAEDVATFIDRHCDGGAHVIGHSRGGRVAFELARRHPNKVRALVLADPGLMLDHNVDNNDDQRDDFRQRAWDAIHAGDVEQGLAHFIDTVNGEGTWHRMVPWFKQMARDNAHTLAAQVRESPYHLTREEARAIDRRVLLVGGALSPPPYPAVLEALHDWLPNAQYARIAGSSHGMNLGNPRAFNEIVRCFSSK